MILKRLMKATIPALAGLVLLVAWSSVWARHSAVTTSPYVSYASGDFFFPPYPSDSDRMGVSGSIELYNPALRAGWYTDWGARANPTRPGGIEYARLIGFQVDTTSFCDLHMFPATRRSQVIEFITGTALIDNLRANPGTLWLIGDQHTSTRADHTDARADLYGGAMAATDRHASDRADLGCAISSSQHASSVTDLHGDAMTTSN